MNGLHSGTLAERSNLRLYLTGGMLGARIDGGCDADPSAGSAFCCALIGMAEFVDIHQLWYFLFVAVCMPHSHTNAHALQLVFGLYQATGWPSVVPPMGNWFPKGECVAAISSPLVMLLADAAW